MFTFSGDLFTPCELKMSTRHSSSAEIPVVWPEVAAQGHDQRDLLTLLNILGEITDGFRPFVNGQVTLCKQLLWRMYLSWPGTSQSNNFIKQEI
jgi:hypothetical protein